MTEQELKISIFVNEQGVEFMKQVTDALLKYGGELNLPGVLLIKQSIRPWSDLKDANLKVVKDDNPDHGNKEDPK
jgi:hypothetical protein